MTVLSFSSKAHLNIPPTSAHRKQQKGAVKDKCHQEEQTLPPNQ